MPSCLLSQAPWPPGPAPCIPGPHQPHCTHLPTCQELGHLPTRLPASLLVLGVCSLPHPVRVAHRHPLCPSPCTAPRRSLSAQFIWHLECVYLFITVTSPPGCPLTRSSQDSIVHGAQMTGSGTSHTLPVSLCGSNGGPLCPQHQVGHWYVGGPSTK